MLVTEWPEFREIPFAALAKLMKRPLLVDSKNYLDPVQVVGRGARLPGVRTGTHAGESGEHMKKVAIIGAGLQAKRRSGPIVEDPNFEVSVVDRSRREEGEAPRRFNRCRGGNRLACRGARSGHHAVLC